MYQSGLWIGGQPRNVQEDPIRVTTASCDRVSTSPLTNYEFTTDIGSTMIERSTLSSASTFSIDAISHQDFVADYTDRYTRVPTAGAIGDSIVNHHPLGVTVHQESYAWNFPYANDFVIISYTIKNITTDTIDNFYVGLWSDNVVRNTNYVRPAVGSSYYAQCGEGYDSIGRMMYTYEAGPFASGTRRRTATSVYRCWERRPSRTALILKTICTSKRFTTRGFILRQVLQCKIYGRHRKIMMPTLHTTAVIQDFRNRFRRI